MRSMKKSTNTENDLQSEVVKQKRSIQKKEILKIASELFADLGYHNTTLEAIAAEMNMTRAALYRYFPSKDEILFQCHKIAYERSLENLERLRKINNPRERLSKMIQSHILMNLIDFPTFGPLFRSFTSFSPEYKKRIVEYRKTVNELYVSCLEDWRNSFPGELKEIDNQILVNIILSTLNSVFQWAKAKEDPKIIAQQIVSVLIDGICN